MKRTLALLLVAMAIVGLFAGCTPTPSTSSTKGTTGGSSSETPYPVGEDGQFEYGDTFEDVTVEWWIGSNYELNDDMWFFKKLEEEIGCTINLSCWDAETYSVKCNTALNTAQLPDIMGVPAGGATVNVYGEQGAFVDLNDPAVRAKMPNFNRILTEDPDAVLEIKDWCSENGGLYTFPTYDYNRDVNHGWMYRRDVFEKHNIPMWTDSESFLNTLRKLKELYPNSYPMTGADLNNMYNRVLNSFGSNHLNYSYDWETGEWYFGACSDGYYEMLKVFQTAWNEKLIDPNFFSNQNADLDAAIVNGESFVYNSWIGRMAVQNKAGREVDPNFQVAFAAHIGDGKANQNGTVLGGGGNVVISAKSSPEKIDACLAIWDYIYSEEGAHAVTMGEEGVTYDVVDGKYVYKNPDGTLMELVTIATLEEKYGLWNSNIFKVVDKNSCYFEFTPEEAEAQIIGLQGGYLKAIPSLKVPEEYTEEWTDLITRFNIEVVEFTAKFVTQNYTRADFDTQVQTWQKNFGRAIDIMNGDI